MNTRRALHMLLICFNGLLCLAQPKGIGLVLSGGGARAMAHVGVLQIIDSAGLQVSYIAGTSMGAVVGAFYAMGYSGKQIEAIMRSVDWQAVSDNRIQRKKLSYFDRKQTDKYLLSLPITDKGISIPAGINYGYYILQTLSRLTVHYPGYQDFRKFPIPFVCTGTDIENGILKEFDEGIISDILRATTAFPSIFSPYEVDGRLYVDGGVMDNLPISLLKKRGVQFILASDVQNAAYTKEELNSINKILEQAATFASIRAYQDYICEAQMLLQPKVPEAGLLSFELMDRVIQEGRNVALRYWDTLVALAKIYPRAVPYQRELPPNDVIVSNIRVSGSADVDENYITAKLGFRKNTALSFDKIHDLMDQIYGRKNHEIIKYDLFPITDTSHALNFYFKPFKYNQYLRLGLHFDTDFGSAFLFSYYNKNLIFRNSFLNIDLVLGDNPRGNFTYFIDRGVIPMLGIRGRFNTFRSALWSNERPINFINYTDLSSDIFIQSILTKSISVTGGVQTEFFNLIPTQLDNPLIRNNLAYLNYFGQLHFDNLDQLFKPQKGAKVEIIARVLSRTERYQVFIKPTTVISGYYMQALGYGRVGMNLSFQSTISLGNNQFFPYRVFLGGLGNNYFQHIHKFAGYRFLELSGRQNAVLRGEFFFRTFPNQYFTFTYNVGKIGEEIPELITNEIIDGYAITYSVNTLLGPIELSLMGNSNSSRILGYISVGYWF
ncbi:patatin-like phospholipase family protein [Thermaurantimonas aggregans]|nr:patatin-like phospholipase family protein [Thermaurantimonas aggregans]MCX8147813.1 patatin-like phospholipase family protein [Thermaurantimonas aggregans]